MRLVSVCTQLGSHQDQGHVKKQSIVDGVASMIQQLQQYHQQVHQHAFTFEQHVKDLVRRRQLHQQSIDTAYTLVDEVWKMMRDEVDAMRQRSHQELDVLKITTFARIDELIRQCGNCINVVCVQAWFHYDDIDVLGSA